MWLEEAQEFVKACIDGLMLMHRIFSEQNRDRARDGRSKFTKIQFSTMAF
jgi:hypothetical protein